MPRMKNISRINIIQMNWLINKDLWGYLNMNGAVWEQSIDDLKLEYFDAS